MKTIILKNGFRIFSVFTFFLFSYTVNAQDQKEVNGKTYTITDNGTVQNIQPYIDALNNSDFKYHRLLNKRYTITFQTGVKVELFSAKEISQNGLPIVLSDYPENFDSSRQEPIFALAANNFIMEYHTAMSKEYRTIQK